MPEDKSLVDLGSTRLPGNSALIRAPSDFSSIVLLLTSACAAPLSLRRVTQP